MTNSCIKLVNESLIAASHQKCVSKELAVKDRKTSQFSVCLLFHGADEKQNVHRVMNQKISWHTSNLFDPTKERTVLKRANAHT